MLSLPFHASLVKCVRCTRIESHLALPGYPSLSVVFIFVRNLCSPLRLSMSLYLLLQPILLGELDFIGVIQLALSLGNVHRFSDSYNNIVKESYTDGNNFRQGQFESYIYQITEGTHLTCYGRGFVPASALSVSMGALSSGDVMALFRIYYTYGKAVMENLVLHLTDTFTWAKQQAISKLEL